MGWPIGNLDDFREALDAAEPLPFYAVILYAAQGDADASVRAYVRGHRSDSAAVTGEHCRAFVLENVDQQPLDGFPPVDVATIAEYLGADRSTVPGIVFFTEPAMQPEGLWLRLGELLHDPADDPAGIFGDLASMVSASASAAPDDRLPDLRRRLTQTWPPELVSSGLVEGGSVAMAMAHIVGQIRETA